MQLLLPKRQEGQGLVEYALLLVLVAVVVIGVLMLLGPQIRTIFGQVVVALGGGGNYNYQIQTSQITAATEGPRCNYKIDRIQVKVTDMGGSPVDGVTVAITVRLPNPANTWNGHATTNSGGVAAIANTSMLVQVGACQHGTATVSVAGGAATQTDGY